jgi:hypothetical protein
MDTVYVTVHYATGWTTEGSEFESCSQEFSLFHMESTESPIQWVLGAISRKHCEIKRITNVPDRATARRGGAQLVVNIIRATELVAGQQNNLTTSYKTA